VFTFSPAFINIGYFHSNGALSPTLKCAVLQESDEFVSYSIEFQFPSTV
jgi:hypothetical protein